MTDQPFTMEAWIKWSNNYNINTKIAVYLGVIACIGGGYYSDGGIWWVILRNALGEIIRLSIFLTLVVILQLQLKSISGLIMSGITMQ